MKLIKTSLVALIATLGFFSSAQEVKTAEEKPVMHKATSTKSEKIKTLGKTLNHQENANKRAQELNNKVQLNEEQFSAVVDLFTKVENRRGALTNLNEEEKKKALNDLQKMENDGLNEILTSSQKKTLSTPKTTKTATSM